MRRKIKRIDCIEYLSVQAPLEKVNMLEDKQSKYIHDHVKKSGYIGIRCYVKDWQEERGYY